MKDFWNRILLTKHSDETIEVLGKAIGYGFFHGSNPIFEDTKKSHQSYWTRQVQMGSTDRILTKKTFLHDSGSKKC